MLDAQTFKTVDAPSNLAVLLHYILPNCVLDLLESMVAGIDGEIRGF